MAFLLSWNSHEMCMVFSISIWCLFSYVQCICHPNVSQVLTLSIKKHIKNDVLCENHSKIECMNVKVGQ